jgi:hypothetical protein
MPLRRSRGRETEFMFREICMAILPLHSLASTFCDWEDIVERLAEPPRKRSRYSFS